MKRAFLKFEAILKAVFAGVAVCGLVALAGKAAYEAWRHPGEAILLIVLVGSVVGIGVLLDRLHRWAAR